MVTVGTGVYQFFCVTLLWRAEVRAFYANRMTVRLQTARPGSDHTLEPPTLTMPVGKLPPELHSSQPQSAPSCTPLSGDWDGWHMILLQPACNAQGQDSKQSQLTFLSMTSCECGAGASCCAAH